MLAAVRILFLLGIRRLFLLGVDFQMSATTKYHFDKDRAFFFQAEDGIRYIGVTGVQTCALPISASGNAAANASAASPTRHQQASPSPSAVPSTSVPATAPANEAPPNFQATSVTFVGLDSGFVLGQAGTPGHCGPPARYICTSIAGTADHGGTWHGVSAPVTGAPAGSAGVSQVRFYNTSDGWA